MKNFLKYLSVSVLSLLVMWTWFAIRKSGQPSEVVYKSIKATLNGTTTGTTYFEVTGWMVMDGGGNSFITGWALTGYLTGFTETDPVRNSVSWNYVGMSMTGDWNTAYGWWDHALAWYLTGYTETDPIYSADITWLSNTYIPYWNWSKFANTNITYTPSQTYIWDPAEGASISLQSWAAIYLSPDSLWTLLWIAPNEISFDANTSRFLLNNTWVLVKSIIGKVDIQSVSWTYISGWLYDSLNNPYITWAALSGYLTGYTETDPIWMANSGDYIPRTSVTTGMTYPWSDTLIPSEKAIYSLLDGIAEDLGDVLTTGWYYISGTNQRRTVESGDNYSIEYSINGWLWRNQSAFFGFGGLYGILGKQSGNGLIIEKQYSNNSLLFLSNTGTNGIGLTSRGYGVGVYWAVHALSPGGYGVHWKTYNPNSVAVFADSTNSWGIALKAQSQTYTGTAIETVWAIVLTGNTVSFRLILSWDGMAVEWDNGWGWVPTIYSWGKFIIE